MHILVRGARQLLTLRGPKRPRRGAEQSDLGLVEDGAVLIRDGVIVEAGPSRRVENLKGARGAEEIDAAGRVVMPGFVDSHTHLVCGPSWLEEYEERLTGAGGDFVHFPDLRATFHSMQTQSVQRIESRAFATVAAMARHGTTSVEGKSGFGANANAEVKILRVLAGLDRHPLDVVSTYFAAHWGERRDAHQRLEWMRSHMLPRVRRRGLADFVDIRCDNQTFGLGESRAFLESARSLGFQLKVHAAESPWTGGVNLAVEMGAVSVEHLEYAGAQEAAILARSGAIATLLPGWAYYLGKRYAPARELIARGVPVALASGYNPHTSPTCSMQMIVSLACSQLRMTPAEAIVAATVNGAHALRRGVSTGSLEQGSGADLLLLNISDYREIPYHFGLNQVHMTIKRGTVVYREGAVLRAAGG